MDKMVEYIIGGSVALLILFALATPIVDQYEQVQDSLTEQPEVSAALLVVLLVFFLAAAWKMYKSV